MPQRGRPSIAKRQKELSRQEKREEKAERRASRKHRPLTPAPGSPETAGADGAAFDRNWRWTISAKLFVGNLSFRTTKEQLLELFLPAGRVVDVVLPADAETGRPRGFAFVEFSAEAEAKDAIQRFNGFELDGRALRINEAEARPPRGPRPFVPRGDHGGGGDFGNPFGEGRQFKAKGSRRHLRARKRGG